MWRYASSCAFSGALAAFGASRALAADPPCSPIAVAADARVRARWPELPGQVRQAFEARTDIDPCARVELAMNEGSIAIAVTLPDGRSASRQVSGRENVMPTLEALLVVPRAAAGSGVEASAPSMAGVEASAPSMASAPSQAIQATAIAGVAVHPAAAPRDEMETRRASDPPRRLRIELSVLTDARIGDGQTSVGLGAVSLLDIGGWLVGFEGRADRDQRIHSGYRPGGALELAALGGRRLRFQNLALDFVGGAAVALRGSSSSTPAAPVPAGASPDPGPGGGSSQSPVGPLPRALVGAHLVVGARSTFRTFVGVEGEFGPAGAPGGDPDEDFRLPLWTVGLAMGATVGTQ